MKKLRGHHLLCIPRFKVGGYNKEIRNKIKSIQKEIIKNPNKKVKIIMECDDICDSCPYKDKNKCNKSKEMNRLVKRQDEIVLKILNIEKNSTLKANEVFLQSINTIGNKEIKKICNGCEYLNSCLKYKLNTSFTNRLK